MSVQLQRPERSSLYGGKLSSLRLPSFVVLSCLLHVSLHAALSPLPEQSRPAPPVADELEISLQVEPAAVEPAREAAPLDVVPPAQPDTPRAVRPSAPLPARAAENARPGPATEALPGTASVEVAPPLEEPPPVVAPTVEQTPKQLDLSPTQVARAFLGESQDLPVPSAPRAAPKIVGSIATNESVARSLMPAVVDTQREPVLTKRSDGGYTFRGNGSQANIRRDGSLVMSDQYGHATAPLVPMQLPNGEWRASLGGVGFDLSSYMEHLAGNDPFRSERRWFLEKTRSLRESLAEKAADASTRARLARIWHVPNLSLAERKRATFAVWDECTEDSVGMHGRAVIERYVRESCAESEPRGFTREDLLLLNNTRKSRPLFAPYASVVDRPDASN